MVDPIRLVGMVYLEMLAIPATLFWVVGLTNTVNLIDGLDGLAAGVASIAAITILLVRLLAKNCRIIISSASEWYLGFYNLVNHQEFHG